MVQIEHHPLHINGRKISSRSGRTYGSVDPYTGKVWATVADGCAEDVDAAVSAARTALEGPWSRLTAPERGALLLRLAELIQRDADKLADIEVRDGGKLLREMSGQMRGLSDWYTYYAGLADKMHGKVIPTGKSNFLVYTRNEPIGVVAAITPWNSPLLLLTWKLAPALAAGCTMVVKPSDHTPVSTLVLAELVDEAGFPPGVINVVTGWGPETGKALVAHPGVNKVAFTGSTEVGKVVAKAAADNLSRVTLELGGKSAQVVFEDADLEAAASGVISGIFAAAGQTCLAGARLLVHESVADKLVELIADRTRRIVLGDPRAPETEMGPVSNGQQFSKIVEHLRVAKQQGARVVCGGSAANELGGYFIYPTILCDLPRDATAVVEEIFGPVLVVQTFTDEDDAIAQANDTPFGLAGSVWTKDIRRAHRVAERMHTGTVWINSYRVVAPQVPFGGIGQSGIGRESGADAILDFTEKKAVWVELSGESRDPFTLG